MLCINIPVMLAAVFGLHRLEALGPRWSSINFKEGKFTIRTIVVRQKEKSKTVTTVRNGKVKTDTSKRELPLNKLAYDILLKIKAEQEANQVLCGHSYNPNHKDFVCVDKIGTLLQPYCVLDNFAELLKKNRLRHIHYHDLRYSCTSILNRLGYSIKDIQTWLEHSDFNFTANTYVHSSDEARMEMSDGLSDELGALLSEKTNP